MSRALSILHRDADSIIIADTLDRSFSPTVFLLWELAPGLHRDLIVQRGFLPTRVRCSQTASDRRSNGCSPVLVVDTDAHVKGQGSPVGIQVFMTEAHDIGSTKFSTKRPTDKIPITFPTENQEEPHRG